MTEKEQIKEMYKITSDFCDTNKDCWSITCDHCACLALYYAGYRKVVWHKVSDGDLPDTCKRVLVCALNRACDLEHPYICIGSYHTANGIGEWWLDYWNSYNVIAWTELPEYKEVK